MFCCVIRWIRVSLFFRLIFSRNKKNWSVPRCQRPTARVRFAPIDSFRTARQKSLEFRGHWHDDLPWPWFSPFQNETSFTAVTPVVSLFWNPAGLDKANWKVGFMRRCLKFCCEILMTQRKKRMKGVRSVDNIWSSIYGARIMKEQKDNLQSNFFCKKEDSIFGT